MESFWATLKTKLIFHRGFVTIHQANRHLPEYIDMSHNRQRIQKQLNDLSQASFERLSHEQRLAA